MAREILVRGESEVGTLPDHAGLRVVVAVDEASEERAYAATARLAAAVDLVLTEFADAISRTTGAAIVVAPRQRWRKGESINAGWTARRLHTVEVTGLDRLGPMIERLVGAGAAVQGPDWRISPEHPAHGEARRRAAEQARAKAETYAHALGVALGEIAWVAEPGLRMPNERSSDFAPMGAGRLEELRGGGDPAQPIDITPVTLAVRAAVEVAFTIA